MGIQPKTQRRLQLQVMEHHKSFETITRALMDFKKPVTNNLGVLNTGRRFINLPV